MWIQLLDDTDGGALAFPLTHHIQAFVEPKQLKP